MALNSAKLRQFHWGRVLMSDVKSLQKASACCLMAWDRRIASCCCPSIASAGLALVSWLSFDCFEPFAIVRMAFDLCHDWFVSFTETHVLVFPADQARVMTSCTYLDLLSLNYTHSDEHGTPQLLWCQCPTNFPPILISMSHLMSQLSYQDFS